MENHHAASIYLKHTSLDKPKSVRNEVPKRDFATVLEKDVRVRKTSKKKSKIRKSHQQAARGSSTLDQDPLPNMASRLRNSSNPYS